MAERWTSDEILRFLDSYKKYDILWNKQFNGHRDKNARENALKNLIKDMNMEGLTLDIVRSKIKMIKTVYNQERNKILKSQLNATEPSDVYKPRLSWFEKANSFLQDVCSSRFQVNSKRKNEDEEYDDHNFDDNHDNDKNKVRKLLNVPNKTPVKKIFLKKHQNSFSDTKNDPEEEFDSHLATQNMANQNLTLPSEPVMNKDDDEFDYFGKYIAAQMRHLPEINALHCQEQILSIITQERIAFLHQQADVQSDSYTDRKNFN